MTDHDHHSSTPREHSPDHGEHVWKNAPVDEPLDQRCDAGDRQLDEQLARTAPRSVPAGLVDRIVQASLPALIRGRRDVRRPLVFAGWGRLAAAACIALAIGALFWLVSPGPDRSMPVAMERDLTPRGVFEPTAVDRFRGLVLVSNLHYTDAVAGLELVLDSVAHGAPSYMVLSPGNTPREHVENELDAVHAVTLHGS